MTASLLMANSPFCCRSLTWLAVRLEDAMLCIYAPLLLLIIDTAIDEIEYDAERVVEKISGRCTESFSIGCLVRARTCQVGLDAYL